MTPEKPIQAMAAGCSKTAIGLNGSAATACIVLLSGIALFPTAIAQQSLSTTVPETELNLWMEHAPEPYFGNAEQAMRDLALTHHAAHVAENAGIAQTRAFHVGWMRERGRLAWKMLNEAVADGITPDPELVQHVVEISQREFQTPPRRRTYSFYRAVPRNAAESHWTAAREAVAELHRQITSLDDFKRIARAQSDSQTRYHGGLIGNIRPDDIDGDLDEILENLPPGELSEIYRSATGLHFFYCERVLAGVPQDPDQLRERAREEVKRVAVRKTLNELIERMQPLMEITMTPVDEHDGVGPRFTANTPLMYLTADDVALLIQPQDDQAAAERRVEELAFYTAAAHIASVEGLLEQSANAVRMRHGRLSMLATEGIAKSVRERFEPPDVDHVKEYFDSYRSRFKAPAEYTLSSVRLDMGEDERASFEAARSLRQQLIDGALSLTELTESLPPGHVEIGVKRPRDRLTSHYGLAGHREIANLEMDVFGKIVSIGKTLWIFRVENVTPDRLMTWEEAQDRARQRLSQAIVNYHTNIVQQELFEQIAPAEPAATSAKN